MVRVVRTNLPRVLAASVVVCLLVQAPAVASPDRDTQRRKQAERRGEQIEQRLRTTRSRLAETRAEQRHTRATLRRLDAEQTALAAELAALDDRLDTAEDRLVEAETALRRAQGEIARTREALNTTGRDLALRQDLLRQRTRRSYMHGGVTYPEAVLDIDTVNQLGVSLQYMQTIMAASQDRVEDIAALEREYEALLARLDELKQVIDEVRHERAEQRDDVAALVAGRREVEARLAAREHEHRTLLARLEASADRYRAAIDDLEAEGRAIEKRLARIAARQRADGVRRPDTALQWPVNGVITSGYGYRTHPVLGYSRLHAGTDFGASTGTPIVAAAGGAVVSAGWMGGYGNAVVISHGGGLATLYAHQSRLAVSTGARVARGQVIGYVGSTGMSTGPHLHFEVRVDGVTTDPVRYL
ncbi:MAG TPA: peptidoglycan DD-metalloendopeptidase family protein [Euzebyales bacterium]